MKKVDLTKGKELSVITALSLPLIGSSLLQFSYNFIDMLFVGALGSNAVAAVGSASFFINIGYAIQAMIVTGGAIKIAHAMGEKKEKKLSSYIGSGLFLNTIIGILTIFVLLFFGENLLGFLDLNNTDVSSSAYQYLVISAFMLFFSYFNGFFMRMLSSLGNNKQSFYISAFGLVVNIILDPIFIYVFNWGVSGAAIATLVAQILMFLIYVYRLQVLLFSNENLKISSNHSLEIIRLGIPISTQRVLFTVINIILAKFIAEFGTDAIAAQKIALQIESLTFIVMGALNGAISSFIGQNFGAVKHNRIAKGYRIGLTLGMAYAIVTSFIFIFFSEQLAQLFVRDQETVKITANYLEIIGLSQIFVAMEMITNGAFTGIGLPKIPSIISIIFTALRIPLAIILIKFMGLNGIWWSIAISSALKGMISVFYFRFSYKKEKVV